MGDRLSAVEKVQWSAFGFMAKTSTPGSWALRLEFSERAGLINGAELSRLIRESKELAAIFGASRRTATAKSKLHAADKKSRRR